MQSWLLLFRAASRVELLRHLSRCRVRHNVAGEAGVAPKKEGRFPHITLKTKEVTDETESARRLLLLLSLSSSLCTRLRSSLPSHPHNVPL